MTDNLFSKQQDGSIVPSPGWDVFRDVDSLEGQTWYVPRIYKEDDAFYITMFDFVSDDLKDPSLNAALRVIVKDGVVICINEALFRDSPWATISRLAPKPNGYEFVDPIQDGPIPTGDIVKVDVAIVDANDLFVSLIVDAQSSENNIFSRLDEGESVLEILYDVQTRLNTQSGQIRDALEKREAATDQIGHFLHLMAKAQPELEL